MKRAALALLASSLTSIPGIASTVNWDGRLSAIKCDQIPAEFTLGENQHVREPELDGLCNCITERTNRGGWEINTLKEVKNGSEVSLMQRGAIKRFGDAVKYCSDGKYFDNVDMAQSADSETRTSTNDQVSVGTQKLLGFVGGGPIGIVIAPKVYQWVSGNLIAWLIIGAIVGGFSWNIQIGLIIMLAGMISKFISGK